MTILLLPPHLWDAIDNDCAKGGANRVFPAVHHRFPRGVWLRLFAWAHAHVPVVYPPTEWLYHNGEGVRTPYCLLLPPGAPMVGDRINLDRSTAWSMLKARAAVDDVLPSEVLRRTIRAHFDGHPPGALTPGYIPTHGLYYHPCPTCDLAYIPGSAWKYDLSRLATNA